MAKLFNCTPKPAMLRSVQNERLNVSGALTSASAGEATQKIFSDCAPAPAPMTVNSDILPRCVRKLPTHGA
jgi:hypothetical protein